MIATRRAGRPRRAAGGDHGPVRRALAGLVLLVPVVAVAALGFRLGRGDEVTAALTTAVAVLVAGVPAALLLVLIGRVLIGRVLIGRARTGRGSTPGRVVATGARRGEHADDRRRFVTALYRAAGVDLVGPPGPGVSDLDGTPGSGLRGIVSERVGDRVVAHAVLVGPPGWLAEHGVAADPAAGPAALCVAWDGELRGTVRIVPVRRWRARLHPIGATS